MNHTTLKTASAAIAGAAVIWPQLPPAWVAHVPGWLLGVLAVVTMLLPSPVIRDPQTPTITPTVPQPAPDNSEHA